VVQKAIVLDHVHIERNEIEALFAELRRFFRWLKDRG
jgi:hypothetical protein